MGIFLDHTIVEVTDVEASIRFYRDILGFKHLAGQSAAFEIIQINENLGFDLLAVDAVPSHHFAFCMDKATFDTIFERVKTAGIPYGDSYQSTGNMKGPGQAPGTRGMADAIYFYDPSGHLLEIRHYSEDD